MPIQPHDQVHQSLVMGALCTLVGLAAGLWISWEAIGEGFGIFVVAAPLAAFASGSGVWWLLRARRGRTGAAGGSVAGTIAALVGHWVCWYGIMIERFLCYLLQTAVRRGNRTRWGGGGPPDWA